MTKFLSLVFLLPNWMLYTLSWLAKRDRNLSVFGVHTSSFSGNIKSLFCATGSDQLKVFISTNNTLIKRLQAEGYTAHTKNSIKGFYYALRAGTYVYSGFPSDINFWLSGGAKYVNVWHGTPIKKIERDVSTGYYSIRNRYRWLYNLVAPYFLTRPDALLVSSPYEEQCLKSAFALEEDVLVRAFPPRLETLVDQDHHTNGITNILYAPTWRDDHSFRVENYINWYSFNTFLEANELMFYIKLHPSDKTTDLSEEFSHIIVIGRDEDIYEQLRDTDILITDYSSMIFESLYLAKPVILFCPDHTSYQQASREMYIDPCLSLPTEVAYSQEDLEEKLFLCRKKMKFTVDSYKLFFPYPIQDKVLEKLIDKAYT
jgi:CDP-glycerol glycerophosphotransferase (TagB/SpsB family)